ncbi:MAG: hypothetical protein KDD47_20375, partial [Acidobacteria bacterium]|nr:hypothetical protein [Acidobacteriota bacterium]
MAYVVLSVAGDTLCSIARREGFSNCGTLRTTGANAGLLNGVLPPGSAVTIPQARGGWVYTKIAMGRRWTVRWRWPVAAPQAKVVRFVRTGPTPPANGDAIANLRISRYITSSADGNGNDDWVDHTHRTYDLASYTDSDAFNVEVVDPDRAGQTCVVRLEALRPTYAAGVLNGHQRFPAGAQRNARSLEVTLDPVAGDNTRHRSCYIRLVVDQHDKGVRPLQTLLVSDMVVAGDPEVEILDQDVRLLYEDPQCPRPAGDRCVMAQAEIPLRRGRSVRLVPRILRANRSGVVGTVGNGQGDDGVITRQELTDRIQQNVRRIWAQEEITFTMAPVETVDMPSDMLTVSDPEGAVSSGVNAGGVMPGVVGFTLTVELHAGGGPVNHDVGPYQVPAANTTQQTANALAGLVNALHVANLVTAVSQNPAIDGHAAG